MLMIDSVWNGGHVSCLFCCVAFYQIQSWRRQYSPYGTPAFYISTYVLDKFETFTTRAYFCSDYVFISLTISTLHFTVAYGLGAAARYTCFVTYA